MGSLAKTAEFGALAPLRLDQAVIGLTSSLPDNWIGLRLAILLRRITTMRLDYPAGALDVVRWGMRLRLHPRDNGCEKNLLFTPQMYEATELAHLRADIDRILESNRDYVFIDIGANVGLFSFFVAGYSRRCARIVAVEPEVSNMARLQFNIRANPGVPIQPVLVALGDEAGELAIELNRSDRGGTRTRKLTNTAVRESEGRVKAQTLFQLLKDQSVNAIDAIKIDVEGAEDSILVPFFQNAPKSLWPRLILIEDARGSWATDLFAFLAERGFAVVARTKLNAIL